jgi:hypothetical protein
MPEVNDVLEAREEAGLTGRMEPAAPTARPVNGAPHPASDAAARQREEQLIRRLEEDDRPPAEGLDAVEAAANAALGHGKLKPEEQVEALEWFLSPTDDTDLSHTFEINVGSPTQPKWTKWTIKPVDMEKLRKIRRQSQQTGNRRERRSGSGEFDEMTANVQIVVEATVYPDLRDAARTLGIVDPATAVRTRFSHKPGLLTQIAGEVMSLSGYDDEDVREVDAARG